MEKTTSNIFEKNLSPVTSIPISINDVGQSLTSDQKFTVLEKTGHEGLQTLDDIPEDTAFIISKIETLSTQEGIAILKDLIELHQEDINFPEADYERIVKLVDEAPLHLSGEGKAIDGFVGSSEKSDGIETNITPDDWSFLVRLDAAIMYFHSPYPEIRAVTDPFDDENLPVETIRAYLIGLIWVVIGAFINGFFYHRNPSISLSASIVQVFLYPSGKLAEKIFPDWGFTVRGTRYSLNPGPWSTKEQLFSTIMFNVAAQQPYVIWNILVQKLDVYYGNTWVNWGYQILLAISTQFLGFGIAGILRRFVIYPTRSIWPSILPTLALNRALLRGEKREIINGWKISRYNFFFIVFAASFVYFWLPDYLFQALSYFNWITWIKPDNFNLAMITGSVSGMGINPWPTFDMNMVFFYTPLTLPFYTQLNNYIGMVMGMICIVAVFWSNYKWTAYIPLNTNALYTNTGEPFDVTQVLNDKNLFDQDKYEAYSPPFYSAANLVLYGAFFAIYPFGFIYTIMDQWHGMKYSMIQFYGSLRNWRQSQFEGFDDAHTRMMSKYKEVPDWCYGIVLVVSFVFGVILVEVYPDTNTPVWSLVFIIALNVVFLIPFNIIASVTGFTYGLNVLAELLVGYALPGNGIALMLLKAYGYNIDGQAQTFVSDLKMGHYGKIPPRALFRGQMLSTLVSIFVSLATLQFVMSSVDGLCTPHQSNKFTCPSDTTYFSASIIWGVIGPRKIFGGIYPALKYCFLIGALLPFPCFALKKYGPKSIFKYFQPTIMMGGFLWFAPYNLSYFTSGLYASFAFMYFIRKRYLSWWEKYNYLLSAGITAGIAFSAIIIFFAVQYHPKDINWWGNTVQYAGIDGGNGQQVLYDAATHAEDGYFGPRKGFYP